MMNTTKNIIITKLLRALDAIAIGMFFTGLSGLLFSNLSDDAIVIAIFLMVFGGVFFIVGVFLEIFIELKLLKGG